MGSPELFIAGDGTAQDFTVTEASSAIPVLGTGDLVIGEGFTGWVDEVRIWNRENFLDGFVFDVADRRFGTVLVSEMTNGELAAYYRFEDGEYASSAAERRLRRLAISS